MAANSKPTSAHISGYTTMSIRNAGAFATIDGKTVASTQEQTRGIARARTMKCYDGRLILGGIEKQNIVAWNAGHYFDHPSKTSGATRVIVELSTDSGQQTVSQSATLPITSTWITPIVTVPDSRAVKITIEAQINGIWYRWSSGLTPIQCLDIACAINPTLESHEMAAVAGPVLVPITNDIDTHGDMILAYRALNPLVWEHESRAAGAEIEDLVAVGKPLYSGGFGRYPMYVLTRGGVYALPQNYGEARLVSYYRIAAGSKAVEGADCAYFLSDNGWLCRINGATVTAEGRSDASQLAWSDYFRELWLVGDGVEILQRSGRRYARGEALTHLWHNPRGSWGTDSAGNAYELAKEDPARREVEWLSHPIIAGDSVVSRLAVVVWNLFGDSVNAGLSVLGESGASCHGRLVNRMKVNGNVAAPIRVAMLAYPLRTFRLRVAGEMGSGTILRPTKVETAQV